MSLRVCFFSARGSCCVHVYVRLQVCSRLIKQSVIPWLLLHNHHWLKPFVRCRLLQYLLSTADAAKLACVCMRCEERDWYLSLIKCANIDITACLVLPYLQHWTFQGFEPLPGEHSGFLLCHHSAMTTDGLPCSCSGMQCDFNNLRVFFRPPDTAGTEIHRSSVKSAAVSLGNKPIVCFRLPGKSLVFNLHAVVLTPTFHIYVISNTL